MDVNGKKLMVSSVSIGNKGVSSGMLMSEIPINPLIFLVKEKKDGVYLEPANI